MQRRILIIGGTVASRVTLKARLAEAFFSAFATASPHEALTLAQEEPPDLVILTCQPQAAPKPKPPDAAPISHWKNLAQSVARTVHSPAALDADGALALLGALRADPATSAVPVVVHLADENPALRVAALAAGADALLSDPIDISVLLARIRSLLRQHESTRMLSDAWGGLYLPESFGLDEAPAGFTGAAPQHRGTAGPLSAAAGIAAGPDASAIFDGQASFSQSGHSHSGKQYAVGPASDPGLIGLVTADPVTALRWREALPMPMRSRARILGPEEVAGLAHGLSPGKADILLIEAGRQRALGHAPKGASAAADVPTNALGSAPERYHLHAPPRAARYGRGRDHGPDAGLRLMARLAAMPKGHHAMICIVAPSEDSATHAMALDLGADEVVDHTICPDELALRLELLLRRKQRADAVRRRVENGLRLAMVDPLTGAFNRRYAYPRLSDIALETVATGGEFALMVVDLDRFKSVNDRHGHAAGDAVLAEVVRRMSAMLGPEDLLARIGGEEFLIVQPATTLARAELTAERLRGAVADRPISLGAGRHDLVVTISIGLTVAAPRKPMSQQGLEKLIEDADGALRHSKGAGRNIVTLCHHAA